MEPSVDSARAAARRLTPAAALIVPLLAGPTVLAFFTGGYYNEAREWTGVVAWGLVVAALILTRGRLPRTRSALVALGGLALLAGWTLLSTTWAFVASDAYHAGQLTVMYLGALLAAALLLRTPGTLRAVEPALAAGIVIVITYGEAARLLPGLLTFHRSLTAGGRLEQPLTYWNAMGELAAIGMVLAVRVAGDRARPVWMRSVAAAAAAPLGLGLYLTFSRGALFAVAAGVVALVLLVKRQEQLTSLAISFGGAIICSGVAAPLGGVTSLTGSRSARETQGMVMLVVLVVVALAAALVQARWARREKPRALRLPSWAPAAATGLICAGLALAIVVGSKETSKAPLAAGASRLTTFQSDRYAYWDVALRAFSAEPLHGIGAENWWVDWLRYRHSSSAALDAHSLELQTLAELGIVGGALLLMFLSGMAAAGRCAYRLAPELAAGPLAGAIVWLVHSPLDWDWQIPALTLVAVALGGALLSCASLPPADRRVDEVSVPEVGDRGVAAPAYDG